MSGSKRKNYYLTNYYTELIVIYTVNEHDLQKYYTSFTEALYNGYEFEDTLI